jgi:hypothetical protein
MLLAYSAAVLRLTTVLYVFDWSREWRIRLAVKSWVALKFKVFHIMLFTRLRMPAGEVYDAVDGLHKTY